MIPRRGMLGHARRDLDTHAAILDTAPMSIIENFENMLANGQDGALLRFSLGNEYLKAGKAEKAVEHLRVALEHDPEYSAAWKSYGRALAEAGRVQDALAAYEQGIGVAEGKGDKQAAKEMTVFHKRLLKNTQS